jgi:hypothetical protein
MNVTAATNIHTTEEFFYFGGCILLRLLLALYNSGRQSQQSFLLSSPSTHSLRISARAGHLQVNIFFSFFSPEDGPHRPKHVVSEWKEIQ